MRASPEPTPIAARLSRQGQYDRAIEDFNQAIRSAWQKLAGVSQPSSAQRQGRSGARHCRFHPGDQIDPDTAFETL